MAIFGNSTSINSVLTWRTLKLGCMFIRHKGQDDTPPRHHHIGDQRETYELVLVSGGEATHLHNDLAEPIRSGDVLLIAPGESHTYGMVKELGIYNIMFDGSWLRYLDEALFHLPDFKNYLQNGCRTQPKISISQESFPQLIQLAENMLKIEERHEAGGELKLLAVFMEMLFLLGTRHNSASNHPIQRLLQDLNHSYANTWTQETMAKFCHMSVADFRMKFKKQTGHPPIAYLLQLRLSNAAKLLQLDSLRISDAAFRCGFNELNYFSRAFHKKYGVSPKTYQRRIHIQSHL